MRSPVTAISFAKHQHSSVVLRHLVESCSFSFLAARVFEPTDSALLRLSRCNGEQLVAAGPIQRTYSGTKVWMSGWAPVACTEHFDQVDRASEDYADG